jgi:hypothetical protein
MEGEEGGDGLPVCRSALPRDRFISLTLSLALPLYLTLALSLSLSRSRTLSLAPSLSLSRSCTLSLSLVLSLSRALSRLPTDRPLHACSRMALWRVPALAF